VSRRPPTAILRATSRAALLGLGLVASVAPPDALTAQSAGGGVLVQTYRFDDAVAAGVDEYRLLTLPFAASIPVGSHLTVQASGAYAEGRATGPEGGVVELTGVTDTQLGLSISLGPDRMVLSFDALLPTGQDLLSLEEAAVAGVIAAELLPFALTTWGSGGTLGGDLALAFQSGPWGIGLAGGYRAPNQYEPLSGQTLAYRPGQAITGRVAIDRDVGESGTLSLLFGVQHFGDDEVSGSNLFRSGNRLQGALSYAFALGVRSSALLYGSVYHRANGSLLLEESALDGATDSPSQQLFTGGAGIRIPAGRKVTFLPEADLRVFRSADGVGQGWVGTAGAAFDLILSGRRFGSRLVLTPSARYRMGHVTVDAESETDLTGWEAGLTLRVQGGR
jgi:hypothetical protein